MSRIPTDLLARLDYFHREVERLFQRLFGVELGSGFDQGEDAPQLDLLESADAIIVRVDLPGVAQEQIELHAAPKHLILRGNKDPDQPQSDCLRMERAFGPFQRLISMPSTADTSRARARLDQGVLEIHVPKLVDRRSGPKRIAIR